MHLLGGLQGFRRGGGAGITRPSASVLAVVRRRIAPVASRRGVGIGIRIGTENIGLVLRLRYGNRFGADLPGTGALVGIFDG